MQSFKFLPFKFGSLLTRITHLLVLFFKQKKISCFQFFPDFAPPSAKDDAWGQRERSLTFQNMVQEMLLNDASQAKRGPKKFSFFTSKKSV